MTRRSSMQYPILILFVTMSFSFVVLLPETEALVPIFTEVEVPSIARTWEDVELLYPNQFLNTSMVADEVEQLHAFAPQLMDIEVIGQSYEGRDILCVRITNEAAVEQKAKTLVVAHHHGREMVTVNHAILFIQWLVNSYGTDARITNYVDTEEIYVIPTLNPDALDYIYNTSDFWLRKNLRPFDDDNDSLFDEDTYDDANGDGVVTQYEVWEKGSDDELTYLYSFFEGIDDDNDGKVNEDGVGYVDLNRNYDANWGIEPSASRDSMSEAYAGPSPFSEPETRAFRDFAENHRFAMAYSLHTGINATFFVTNFAGNWIEPSLYSQMWNDYREILPNGFNHYIDYSAWSSSHSRPSILSGGWDEWMYHDLDCVAPITFEIYHNASSESNDLYYVYEENATHVIMAFNGIYEYFSPKESHIEKLWQELIPAYEYLLEQIPRLDVSFINGIIQETQVTATLVVEDTSSRIGTQEAIKIKRHDGRVLATAPAVHAARSESTNIIFTLEDAGPDRNITILVGNEFTGYSAFLITFDEGFPYVGLELVLVISFIGVIIVAAYLSRRR